jgi:hypothetical protein
MFQAPYCEQVEVTKEVTECERSCDAQARCEAMCTAPSVSVVVETNLDEERMKAAKLVEALKVGMPGLLKVMKRGGTTIKASVEAYIEGLNGLPDTIKNAGAQAAGCVGAAAVASAQAAVKLKGSLEASFSVNAAAVLRAN